MSIFLAQINRIRTGYLEKTNRTGGVTVDYRGEKNLPRLYACTVPSRGGFAEFLRNTVEVLCVIFRTGWLFSYC